MAISPIGSLQGIRIWLAVLVLALVLGFFAGSLGQEPVPASQPESNRDSRVDQYGDPLPQGALARLGTVRLHHSGYIERMLFSPDGKILATIGNSSVSLWDWANGKERLPLPAAHVGTVAFSPDGKILATASDREKVRLWDIEKTREIGNLMVRRETSMVYRSALAFAEDGKVLVYAGDDGVAQGWDVTTGKVRLFFQLPKKGDMISAIALSPSGKVLAYATRWEEGTNAGPVCLFDLVSGKELHCLRDHKQPVWSLAFSPDGTILASASTTEPPYLWDVAAGKPLRTLQGQKHDPQFLAFSPNGKTLAAGDSWKQTAPLGCGHGKAKGGVRAALAWDSVPGVFPGWQNPGRCGRQRRLSPGRRLGQGTQAASRAHVRHSLGRLVPRWKDRRVGTSDAVWLREAATGKALGQLWQTPRPLFNRVASMAISPDGKYFGLALGQAFSCSMQRAGNLFTRSLGAIRGSMALSFPGTVRQLPLPLGTMWSVRGILPPGRAAITLKARTERIGLPSPWMARSLPPPTVPPADPFRGFSFGPGFRQDPAGVAD